MADAYKALDFYSDEGRFVVAMSLGDRPRREALPLRLTFCRPNKIDLDAGPVRLISDGKTLTTLVRPLKKYTTAPAPATIGIDTFREGPTGPLLFGGPTGADLHPAQPAHGHQPGHPARRDGRHALRRGRRHPDRPPGRARLAPPRRSGDPIALGHRSEDRPLRPADGPTPSIERFGWTAGAIATRLPADRSFAFVVPEGFTATTDLKARAGEAAGAKYAVEEMIGKPAPDFRLTLLDGPAKFREIAKRDLAGKVVLIDFWATWCGPCIVELPEIKKLVDHYNATKREVLIVALSQDMLPEELPALRTLVEKTLTDKEIDLTSGPVGRVGLDPSNSVGRAFNVEGFPSVVILDRKGIVRSAYVGYLSDTTLPLHHVAGQGNRRDPRGQVMPSSRSRWVPPSFR